MAEYLTRLALRQPLGTALLLLLLTLVALGGTARLRSVSYLEGNLPDDDPEVAHYRELTRDFGSDQFAVFAFGCGDTRACSDVFEPGVLELLRSLSDQAAQQSGVADVRSLSRAALLVGGANGLQQFELPILLDAESISRFRRLVEADPLLRGALVSSDLRTTAIIVSFDANLADATRNALALELTATLDARAAQAGFRLHAAGLALHAASTDRDVRRDLSVLTPVMIGLLALLLWWIFRDPASVALALLSVALPTLWAFGAMGWSGRPITPIVSTLPILILVVGITDAVHFLVRVHDLAGSRESLDEVIRQVAHEVGPPTTVTAVTSSLGFLSFLVVSIPSLRDFGIFAALGILGAWLAAFTVIPAGIVRMASRGVKPKLPSFAVGEQLLDVVQRFARRRAVAVLAVAGGVASVSAVGMSRIVPENDAMKLLGEGSALVESERFLRERIRPMDTLEVLYDASELGGVADPRALDRLGRVEKLLSGADHVPVLSILPVLRVANREAGDGTATVPSTRDAASQLLLLAESADPRSLRRVLTVDGRVARLSAGYAWGGSRRIEQDIARLRRELTSAVGDDGRHVLTGGVLLSTHLGSVILDSQVASFSTAIVTILGVILLFVRSLRLGALGLVPNVFPVVVILGFMGLVGIALDVGTAMIASIVLGVSVDDTIYFLVHYQHARTRGATVPDAIGYTFAIAGKPALFCGAMLALGFFVLGFSSFQSLAIFGVLSGFAVLLAAACEIFILPALLTVTAGRREER